MSIYKTYTLDQLEELNSHFLIDSWSYSKVTQFIRNEKEFERLYIYGEKSRSSTSNIAGKAYHYALDFYFKNLKDGTELSYAEAELLAFNFIEETPDNEWQLKKTTPTVLSCLQEVYKTTSKLLTNFYQEKEYYLNDIVEIIESEVYFREFITVDGVDIPMPVAVKIDRVVRLKDGSIVIIDDKSKSKFTPEEDIKLSVGKQAITYILAYEAYSGLEVNEVWFAENKYSSNKDGSPQIQTFKIKLNQDTRRLYESLLYEPLRKLLKATADPDYVYTINDADNMVNKADLYDFWVRTMTLEIEQFNVLESKKDMVEKRMKKIRDSSIITATPKIIKDFRKNAAQFIQYDLSNTNMTTEEKIEHVLRSFGVIVNVAHTLEGYSSNTYLLEVSAGVKITSIQSHKLDIANAIDVSKVRIPQHLKVYNGKAYLALETSKKREKDLFWDENELKDMKIPLGRDNLGNVLVWNIDNPSTPHLLIGGATGSGKSVAIISIIEYMKLAGVKEMYLFDPKYEFEHFASKGIEVYNDVEDIEVMLQILVSRMEEKVKSKDNSKILIVFDEYADAAAAAGKNSTINHSMKRLLQKGRSSGFRIIAAAQRASTKVINGDMKVNFPVQLCFKVPKEVDSRVMIDEPGAESLAGEGDFLLKSPEYEDTVRGQAYYKK